MEIEQILKILMPCPACGGHNLMWMGGYYTNSLICKDCLYEVAPIDENSSIEEVASLWNSLRSLDEAISFCDEQAAKANKTARKFSDLRNHHKWLKVRLAAKGRESSSKSK